MKHGYIHIYTGNGKGKTTAGIGLGVRARGRGLRVMVITFHKNRRPGAGEYRPLRQLGIDVKHLACRHPAMPRAGNARTHAQALRRECAAAVEFIRGLFTKNQYDVLILDEILVSVRDGFLAEEALLSLLRDKPLALEMVLTGRGAARAVIKQADVVTEMREVKHTYQQGITARKGIEY